jgi:hypothetical protein
LVCRMVREVMRIVVVGGEEEEEEEGGEWWKGLWCDCEVDEDKKGLGVSIEW